MKKSLLNKIVFIIVLILVFSSIRVYRSSPSSPRKIKKRVFSILNDIKISKRKEILNYFKELENTAANISSDAFINKQFDTIRDNGFSLKSINEWKLDEYCTLNYDQFYDILFVDSSGFVFYSVKQEKDYNKNIFNDTLMFAHITRYIKENQNTFTNYNFYLPSNESAAFFIIPKLNNGEQNGWYILQSSLYTMNIILGDRKNIGDSGEIYLVKEDRSILSESRFIDNVLAPDFKVDTEVIHKALSENTGESILEDYRGVRVFSSYEKINILGVTWILVVEIDEDEILSDYYKRHKNHILDKMKQQISYIKEKRDYSSFLMRPQNVTTVYMNDYKKIFNDGYLESRGVSTCTALSLTYKGKFSYLAHISPLDESYFSDFESLLPFKKSNSFLYNLLEKSTNNDLIPRERKNVKIKIIATHTHSLEKIIDILLEYGYYLSNITFIYQPDALGVNVLQHASDEELYLEWFNSNNRLFIESSINYPNLVQVLKSTIGY